MRRGVSTTLILALLLTTLCGCDEPPPVPVRFSVSNYQYIPGVTVEEVRLIEELKKERTAFSFGQMAEIEAFVFADGSYGGFATRFCQHLAELFDFPFQLELISWEDLVTGLDNHSLDFTGEIVSSADRQSAYFVSQSIAERSMRVFQLKGSREISMERDLNGMKIGAIAGTMDIANVRHFYPEISFIAIEVPNYNDATNLLLSGEIDAFISKDAIDSFCEAHSNIRSREFFPLIYTPIALTTANPDLEPIISVVTRYIQAGGIDTLYDLYREGNRDYSRYRLNQTLSERELAWLGKILASGEAIPVALEQDNYPISFYDHQVKEFHGIAVDVLKAVSELTGLRFEVAHPVDASWSYLMDLLISGKASLVSQLIQTQERQGNFLWTDRPYTTDYFALLSRYDYPYLAIYQVVRNRVGAVHRTAFEDKFHEWFPEYQDLIYYDNFNDLFDALESGAIDLLMGSGYLLLMQQNYREKPGLKVNVRFSTPLESYFGFNLESAELCSIISNAQYFINLGSITDAWTTKGYDYAKTTAQQRSLYFLTISLILAGILLLSLMIIWRNRRLNRILDRMVRQRTRELTAALAQLQTVISNYSGVIWSVDKDQTITLFDGRFLDQLGVSRDSLIGKRLEEVSDNENYREIIERISLTITHQSQDWISDINGRSFHFHTTPMLTSDGAANGVVGNIQDITDTMRLQLELREALERASEAMEEAIDANKAKSAFLSIMSHEIRTPLNAIIGIADIFLQEPLLAEEIKEAFSKVHTSGDILLGIINDILDLSKIEAGRLELACDKYEVASLINDTAQINMLRIGDKPIEFILQIDPDSPAMLIGDELRIKQILNNLLSNAFKYTDAGQVTLRLSASTFAGEDGEQKVKLILGVDDTGQGMSPEQVNHLYDAYARFNPQMNRSTEGAGLGMSITRNLISLMHGEISVHSELGKGSQFEVTLEQGWVSDEPLGKEQAENLQEFRLGNHYLSRTYLRREPMPYGSVLVVDDVETNLYVAQGLLTPYGLAVDTVTSGTAAIERVNEGRVYDIIFMDHMMPIMDGMEATRIIRDRGYKGAIIALTANAVLGQASVFLNNGFDDFISKPVDLRQLDAVLNKFIRDRQPARESEPPGAEQRSPE
ncbi:MAG: transporter substrate-binding domain-containing protein, partial [Symbiobacteriaceae bacterium]|nr:transporter substrate-binding domain-containing protein [Symbiobacteriaceae bacterium]